MRDLGADRQIGAGAGDPFGAAFRASPVPMLITDARRHGHPVVFVNDAFSALTGYPRDEIVGRSGLLDGPDTDPADLARVRSAIAAGESVELEILSYRKDGAAFRSAVAISPIKSEAGELLYALVSHSAVAGRSGTDDELDEAVARRTLELRQALDKQTVLLHEVDHRVKNTLQVISSLVLLKARRIPDPSAQRALHAMAERITALATMQRLLHSSGDVSRLDLAAFVADLWDDLMSAVEPGRIALRLEVEPTRVLAAKATPIALLVNELATNALRHAFPDGRGGTVAIAARRLDRTLRLSIEDDGIGLGGQPAPPEGFGRTLIDMLVRQLRGRLAWEDAQPGTRVVVDMPLDAEELGP